ncbi:MAG: hypothetical protein KDD67_17625 [Ignavibacteriae bacterium]|nr:hypothetical protein [Ignavibacteriota bacterium]MCB9217486.1 hypothetical protein [Ignavibacteria bacterium]
MAIEQNPIDIQQGRSRIVRYSTLTIVVAGILCTLPVVLIGLSLQTHDGFFHVQWYSTFSGQLFGGELYPRWMVNVNGGLGSPAYFFYPPLTSYTASLFGFLKPFDPFGLHRLGLATTLIMIASGLGMRKWLREFFDERYALIGALVYMLIPFHYSMDLLIRSAVAQVYAYVWLPLILLALQRLITGGRYAQVGLSLAYAALILTHAPTTLLFSPLIPLYVIAMSKPGERLRTLVKSGASLLLGVGLSATYLFTAMAHQKYVNMDSMFIGPFRYSDHWLIDLNLFSLSYSAQVGIVVLLFALIGLFAWLSLRHSEKSFKPTLRRVQFLGFVTMIFCLFMVTPLSDPIWRVTPMLAKVQFPHRFLVIFSLALGVLMPTLFLRREKGEKSIWYQSGRVLLVASILLTLAFTGKYAGSFYRVAIDHHRSPETHRQLRVGMDAYEYVPQVATALIHPLNYQSLHDLVQRLNETPEKWSVVSGRGDVKVTPDGSRAFNITARGETGMTIDLDRFWYPGWIVQEGSDSASVTHSPDYGLVRVTIPAGEQSLRIYMSATPSEHLGNVVSVTSFGVLLLLWGWLWRKNERE